MQSKQLENIGLALQGFGAGIQGQLPAFNQMLQNRQVIDQKQKQAQQQMEVERQKTMFMAAQTGLDMLESGNYDGLIQFGMQRTQALSEMGANPEDTQRLTQLAIAARNGSKEAEDLLKQELKTTVQIGQGMGILEKPKDRKLEVMQLFPANGSEPMTVQGDGMGNFLDVQGNPIQLEKGDRLIEGSTLTGGADDLGVTSKEAAQVREAEIATKTFVDNVGDALALLDETPDINTWAARGAGIINNLQQEVRAIAKVTGVEIDESLLNPEKYKGTFDDLGIDSQRMRSLITSLAYSQALANNPDGRVSNADLNRAVDEIGGSASDPRAFRQVLLDVANRSVRSFQNRHKIVLNKDYESDFGLGAMSGNQADGPTATDPNTGQKIIYRNGQWEPLNGQ